MVYGCFFLRKLHHVMKFNSLCFLTLLGHELVHKFKLILLHLMEVIGTGLAFYIATGRKTVLCACA